jgi:hypothetical protein
VGGFHGGETEGFRPRRKYEYIETGQKGPDFLGRNLADKVHPVTHAKFACQLSEPAFVGPLSGKRKAPARLIQQHPNRRIKPLERMQTRDRTEQDGLVWQIEQLSGRRFGNLGGFLIEAVRDMLQPFAVSLG